MKYSYYKKKVLYARLFMLTFVGVIIATSAFSKQPVKRESDYIIYGKVINKKNQPIPYANIGIVDNLIGTVSNIKGDFNLLLKKEFFEYSLTFSCIGYKSKSFKISALLERKNDMLEIQLEEEVRVLEEVMVSSKNLRTKRIGRKTKSGYLQATFYSGSKKLEHKIGTEIGLKIHSPKYPAYIKDFNFNVSQNTYDHLKFRVNIYSLKKDLPDKLINTKEVLVELSKAHMGWVNVDLTHINLMVTDDCAISLQLLEQSFTKKSPVVTIKGAMSPFHTVYFKNASQGNWSKMGAGINFFATVQY